MSTDCRAYLALERQFARIAAINDAAGILGWDAQTMMPDGAAESRAAAAATLSVLAHDALTDPRTGDWLAEAEAGRAVLAPWQAANLREMRQLWRHGTAVPVDLVEAASRAASTAERVWRTARADSDFASLQPALAEVLTLQRAIGQAKAAMLGCSPYDALLDGYEAGARTAAIDPLFDDLAGFLPGFLGLVLERQAGMPALEPLSGPFPVHAQRSLGEHLMRRIGFDFNRGRLDVSLHPFCGGATNDVRLTTRYDESDFTRALMGVLHETGHALYEQGRPADWLTQPVGGSRGMAVHESQSLIIEMQAARSRPFLEFLAPVVREAFGGSGPAWAVENFHRLYTRVQPGFIRVDADEVTYPAHIILRYRLEKALIAGDLALADLPGAWAEGMHALLGLTPPDDRRGCLQDIHWPCGGWGYFPTYTLGAAIAAQLFDAASRAEPDLRPGLARGDFTPLVRWLRGAIHGQGSLLSAEHLLRAATGRPLDPSIYRRHLERRYLEGE
ncbi:MAG: carboxypeptidase M32 [Rhodospirillaceae bacterium]